MRWLVVRACGHLEMLDPPWTTTAISIMECDDCYTTYDRLRSARVRRKWRRG